MMEKVHVILLVLMTTPCAGQSTSYTERMGNYTALTSSYSFGTNGVYNSVIPKDDLSQPIDVSLQMKLYSIGDIDAVGGKIQLIGALKMVWYDTITNSTINKGSIPDTPSALLVDYRKLWTPVIVLMNSADSVQRVGDETYKVRFDSTTMQVTWQPRVIIDAACAPNVRYFPFDQQECSLIYVPWVQNKSLVKLSVQSDAWDMLDYSENGVWVIDRTTSEIKEEGVYYKSKFTITVNRVPTYFLLNIVFPILCLSLLSGMSFLLPMASGERVGFGITCFLAFVVLLQTLMQYLPRTSSPMSLLCYYVIIMMMFSAALSIVTILLLRLQHKPKKDKMPDWLKVFVELIICTICRRRCCKQKNTVSPPKVTANGATNLEVQWVSSVDKLGDGKDDDEENDPDEVNWEDLGRVLDMFFFMVFLGVQGAVSLFFLVPIAARW